MGDFNKADFTAYIAEKTDEKATRETIFSLLKFAEENAFKVESADNRNFQYKVATRDGAKLLFYCAFSEVVMYLGKFPQLNPRTVPQFVRRLHSLSPGFHWLLRFEDKRLEGTSHPFAVKETLVDPNIMKEFQKAILELQNEIEEVC